MKRSLAAAACIAALMALAPAARAHWIPVVVEPNPIQDDWVLPPFVHELGLTLMSGGEFPPEQGISAETVPWQGHIPCPSEYEGTGAAQVRITNLSGRDWPEVYYVADPETLLTNWDEKVDQAGSQKPFFCFAFKIDSLGWNTPLVFESLQADNVFQAGETWEFVIQDYFHAPGGQPHEFTSLGIASMSAGHPPSTGSVIAVPEPGTLLLLGAAAAAALAVRRRRLRATL